MKAKLRQARTWEMEVMARRSFVLERILDIAAFERPES
jgi:hypothetical protein